MPTMGMGHKAGLPVLGNPIPIIGNCKHAGLTPAMGKGGKKKAENCFMTSFNLFMTGAESSLAFGHVGFSLDIPGGECRNKLSKKNVRLPCRAAGIAV
jgi:hypothetical protein